MELKTYVYLRKH